MKLYHSSFLIQAAGSLSVEAFLWSSMRTVARTTAEWLVNLAHRASEYQAQLPSVARSPATETLDSRASTP